MDFNFAIEATGGGVRGAPALPSRQPVWARGVVGRVILNAPLYGLLLALMMCAGVANAADYPSSCFTKMGNDRVLLMNNDTRAQCPITLQSYYDTNTTKSTYWTHAGDSAPTNTSQFISGERMALFNLKDGTHHILWQRVDSYTNLGGETMVSSNKLWELVNCRAGSVALATSDSNTPRNYFPWTTTSLDIDTGAAMPSTTYNKKAGAGLVIMQNTTDACIISPFYTNGVGAIYFDAVNGWCNNTGELVLEIATETTDGSYFSERSTNLCWETQKLDVLEVHSGVWSSTVTLRDSQVNSVILNQESTASGYTMGRHFFRVRSDVSCRKPIRFRIRRTTAVSGVSQLDSPTYLLVDNIMASYPPLGLEFDIPGKQLDETREKKRVLGWEGALDCCFAFTGQSGACPMAEIPSSVYTPFGVFGPNDFGIKDVKFNYRWTYLGIDSSGWQTLDMQRTDKTKIRVVDPSGLSLTNETGDIEFYYTMTVTNSPHFWPTDFALGMAVSTKNSAGYKTPYGSDWEEGGGEWTCTSRRDASEGKLPSGGTDWFFRLRDGYTVYEDVAVVAHYKSGEETVTSNIWMELVGEHSWRAYVYMPTNMAGKTMAFSFAGYNRQYVSTTGFDVNTNEWKLTTEKIASLPYSGVADGSEIATVPFDLDSTHLLFEFNDETGAFAISHAAFQDFNKWTDAANGYMGYYSTTAAVSEAKQTFAEDFSTWQTSDGYNSLWHEDFNVTGVISNNSPYYPGKPFGANWPTPHGWIANNGMFVCEAYTNTEDGLALELEGCGRGTVELKNLAAGDVPQGLGSVDFTARIAQPYSMDNFAYSLAAYRETNYAFSVKTTLSTRQGSDMSLTDPTVSLVAYYRPGMGCYEARAKRVSATMVELSLWKWGWQGNTLTCKQIGKSAYMGRPVPTNSGILDTTHALVHETATDSDRYTLWHTMSISAYNTSGGTVVQTRLARYRSGYSIQLDRPSTEGGRYADQRYIIVTATDNEANKLTSGAYGMGAVNCAGYFGYPQFHQGMSNSTNFPYYGSSVKLISSDDFTYDWSVPSRYRQLTNKNEYGRNELAAFSWRPNTTVSAENHSSGWSSGLVSKVPEQSVAIRYQLLGSSEWIDIGNVTVTNFLSTYYTFSPRVTEDCYVQLAAGGDRYDTCVDVAVDDIDINSWRGRSTDISKNYGEKDDWVYTSCWVESALGFTGAFSVEPVPGTNEYCYIFTNAGQTITFTPRMDLYL